MPRKYNIYYVVSVAILIIMGLIFYRSMRQMGISLWKTEHRPAAIWATGLTGEYRMVTGTRSSPSKASLATVTLQRIDSLEQPLNAVRVLEFAIQPEDLTDIPALKGYLAVNDFEDRQILVEWYDGRSGISRMDGCELLFTGDTAVFMGSTSGYLCQIAAGQSSYTMLEFVGSRNEIELEIGLYDPETEYLVDEWQYRLVRGEEQ